jgi:arylsulfatase A-like enzyme
MFTSDNGYYLGEQRKGGGKIFPHEPSLRVPMLLRGPGIPAGAVRRDPFTSIDIAPTFAKVAAVEPGLPVDGVSMLRVARRGDQGWTRAILTESHPVRRVVRNTNEAGGPLSAGGVADVRYALGVRTPRYLYVDLATGEEELYDLREDPEQYVNLAGDVTYADVLRHHRRLLAGLRACDAEECRTPMAPVPEPRR